MNTRWASIAKVETNGTHAGTGFLVTPNHVLTALHVVADSNDHPYPRIVLRFNMDAEYGDGSKEWETSAKIVDRLWSRKQDFAVLECDEAPPSKPLVLSDRRLVRDKCSAAGFAVQDPNGFTLIGEISSPNDPLPNGGGTAIGIQLAAGSGLLLKGHSGSALFVNNRVVGLLRTAFLDYSNKTAGGIVHATSIRAVVDHCNAIFPGMLAFHAPVIWPDSASAESPILADRKGEFETFTRMITGASKKRVMLLEGESGSGKTVLTNELAKYAHKLGLWVAKADCKGTPPLNSVIDSLLMDVPGVLAGTEGTQGAGRPREMIEDLATLDRPFLLSLDTWQESEEAVRKWVTQILLPDLSRLPGVVVLISGQRNLPNATGTSWEDVTERRHLQPISSAEDWFEYSRRKWPGSIINRDHVEGIIHAVGGMPNVVNGYLENFQKKGPAYSQAGGIL